MSTQPRLAPTRRTVLRSAAWSTAAVTVVVATPNIAAASPTAPITGAARSVTIIRDEAAKTVVWTVEVTPTKNISAGQLLVTFTGLPDTTLLVMSSGWTVGGTNTATYNSAVASGEKITFTATFTRSRNPKGTATATFSAADFTGSFGTSAVYN